jgi:hypothetical protein
VYADSLPLPLPLPLEVSVPVVLNNVMMNSIEWGRCPG